MGIVDVDAPEFSELIDPEAELTLLGSGYEFSEGPVWNPREQCLYFSDIPGDARWRWSEQSGMELAAKPTFKGNGLAYDVDGNLLVCEQVSSCLTRIRSDGRRELVAWKYEDVYLNSPNDVVVRAADGSIYFTDPDYGRWNDWIGCKRSFVRDFKGVYRVPAEGGDVQLVSAPDEFEQPNGLCFSPDESAALRQRLAPRRDQGLRRRRRRIAGQLPPVPRRHRQGRDGRGQPRRDGVRRARQHLDVGPGRRVGPEPDGERIGAIRTPEICGSVVFGGPDLTTLFLTTTTTVHSMPTKVRSAPLP